MDSFEKKRLEEEITIGKEESAKILELVRRLEDTINLKKDIIATIAHELATPITNMSGYIHLLDEEMLGSLNVKQRKAVKSIKSQFERLKRLVQNTIDLITIKENIIKSSRVDIAHLIEKVIHLVKEDAEKRMILIEKHFADKHVRADVDSEMIEEVFYHLLSNAVKFNKEGGAVKLSLDRQGNYVVADIEDTGIGIPEKEYGKIFDKLYQVEHSITRPYKGAGIGLAIVKMYLELHGGSISVKSKPGEGSIFTVKLPIGK